MPFSICPDLKALAEPSGRVVSFDKDTSGVLVVAKTTSPPVPLGTIQEAYREREYKESSLASCRMRGVDASIGRHPAQRKKMSARPGRGPDLLEGSGTLRSFNPASSPETGRTHQIVHLSSIGHPILGDPRTAG
jgi:23S rRNA-/tRNA-specific pseudouridylate synthase